MNFQIDIRWIDVQSDTAPLKQWRAMLTDGSKRRCATQDHDSLESAIEALPSFLTQIGFELQQRALEARA